MTPTPRRDSPDRRGARDAWISPWDIEDVWVPEEAMEEEDAVEPAAPAKATPASAGKPPEIQPEPSPAPPPPARETRPTITAGPPTPEEASPRPREDASTPARPIPRPAQAPAVPTAGPAFPPAPPLPAMAPTGAGDPITSRRIPIQLPTQDVTQIAREGQHPPAATLPPPAPGARENAPATAAPKTSSPSSSPPTPASPVLERAPATAVPTHAATTSATTAPEAAPAAPAPAARKGIFSGLPPLPPVATSFPFLNPPETEPPRAGRSNEKSFADYGSLSALPEEPQEERPPITTRNGIPIPRRAEETAAQRAERRDSPANPTRSPTKPAAPMRDGPPSAPAQPGTAQAPGRMAETLKRGRPQPPAADLDEEEEDEDEDTHGHPRTRGNPRRSWSGWVILSLGLLGLTLLAWIYLQDAPMRSDEDLRPSLTVDQAVSITAPTRMLSFLQSIVPMPDAALGRVSPWEWDTPSLAAFVKSNGTALDNLRDLLEDFDWHPRHAAWHGQDLGTHQAWPQAALLLQAQSAYMARRLEEDAAFTTSIDLAELSRRLQELWAWPSYMQRSQELHTAACQSMAMLLKGTRLSSAQLQSFQDEFARCLPADAALQDALGAFYLFEKKLLLGPDSDELLDTMPGGIKRRRAARLFFKTNETLGLFADAFRDLKAQAATPPYAALSPSSQPLRRIRRTVPQFYQPNGAGDLYFSEHISQYLDLPDHHSLARANHGLVECFFAIRRHLAEHQKLPAGLAELRPAMLPELPLDPFSGEPFQYNPLKGVLFSVGVNLRGEGGRPGQTPLADPNEPALDLGIAIAAPVKPAR